MLVDAAGADEFPEVFGDKLLTHILDENFGSAGGQGFFLKACKFITTMADIAAHGDHFAAVIFFEPRDDYRGIESARVGKGYFFWFVHRLNIQGSRG